jgi:arginine-tRNA-protein transferase
VLKKNSDTFLEIREPTISDEHLQLYDKYHKYMQEKKGWEFYPVNHEAYEDLYIKGSSTFGKEVAYYIDGKLVGVDLIDLLEDGISSIYFYYDPNFRNYSLGRYSIFKEIELAKEMNKRWVYLGYSVKDNSSLNYKLNYKPHQILSQRPKIDEEAKWHTK